MDAVSYIREKARMCKTITRCSECPLRNVGCGDSLKTSPEKILELVEQWSKEHPVLTNRMKFEEVFGIDNQRIEINSDGYMPTVTIPSSILMKSWWDAEYKGM
jgi:hypothetical protein